MLIFASGNEIPAKEKLQFAASYFSKEGISQDRIVLIENLSTDNSALYDVDFGFYFLPEGVNFDDIPDTAFTTITGEVKSGRGESLPNATVLISRNGGRCTKSVKTDSKGVYFIRPIMPGKYTVKVFANGYKEQYKTTEQIQAQRTETVNFELQKP